MTILLIIPLDYLLKFNRLQLNVPYRKQDVTIKVAGGRGYTRQKGIMPILVILFVNCINTGTINLGIKPAAH